MPDDPQARQVNFEQARPPALPSGDYTLQVTQAMVVTTPGDPSNNVPPTTYNETYQATRTIAVLGPRIALPASTIVARFPPANGSGDYDQVVPHLVLTQDSLPWQRSLILGNKSGWARDDTPSPPWFALLLLDASTAPATQMGTLADVSRAPGAPLPLPAGTVSYGDQAGWSAEWGQSPTDPCVLIDVPREEFLALAPTLDDLPWLVHAREVSLIPSARRDPADEAPGSYAVVCSNRMALSGQRYQAVLVSLEGLGNLLPLDGDTPGFDTAAWTMPSSSTLYSTVRLVALASWSFTAQAPEQTFTGYLTNLHPAPLANRAVTGLGPDGKPPAAEDLPRAPNGADVTARESETLDETPVPDAAQAALVSAYQGGYTLLPHRTRTGDTTASWYHGPLLPFVPTPMAQPDAMSTGPDSLVGYDPDQGLLDMGLATAWQTGQLLALQDTTFARALLAWRMGRSQSAAKVRWGQCLIDAFAPAFTAPSLEAPRPTDATDDASPLAIQTTLNRSIEQALLGTFGVLTRSPA